MKKSYIYFLIPLVGLIIFGVVYIKFNAGYEAGLAAKAKIQRDIKQAKVDEENKQRAVAIKDAQIGSAKRKQEREAKEIADRKEKDEREVSINARDKARRDASKLADQVKRQIKDIEEVKKDISKVDEDKKRSVDEIAFLKTFVKKSEINVKSLAAVLDKIQAADAAAEAAAKAAALAAKK